MLNLPPAIDKERSPSLTTLEDKVVLSSNKSRNAKVHLNRQRVVPNHRGQIRLNGLTVLARRQKTPRAKVPAPQNRQTLSRGKTAFQTGNTTPVRPSSTKPGNPQPFSRKAH